VDVTVSDVKHGRDDVLVATRARREHASIAIAQNSIRWLPTELADLSIISSLLVDVLLPCERH